MECQLVCRPKACPRGFNDDEVNCFECVFFDQLELVNYVDGGACCTCTKEKDNES